MDNISTPRVTCSYLNSYLGRNVLIVGKVMELRGDEAIVDADGSITVHLNRVSAARPSPFNLTPHLYQLPLPVQSLVGGRWSLVLMLRQPTMDKHRND